MLQINLIQEFLSKSIIAVVGISRKGDIPANDIYKKFRESGYKVYPINPNTDSIEGDKCYPAIHELPELPEAVFLAGSPEVSELCVNECKTAGVPLVWMHRGIGQGSYSKNAEEFCQNNGIKVISNGCPFMFLKPVDPFHKLLKWFKK